MRHRKSFNHLGRTSSHRKAMLSNMATSLILHKRITTTVAKAKALRGYVEPLITKSKEDTTHSRRVVFSYLRDKFAVTELFREVAAKVADRPGGYTRIIKLGKRQGDSAEMAMLELVDYNDLLLADTKKKAKSSRRRRGGAKKKADEATAPVVEETVSKEEVAEEVKSEAAVENKDTAVENSKAEDTKPAEEDKASETENRKED